MTGFTCVYALHADMWGVVMIPRTSTPRNITMQRNTRSFSPLSRERIGVGVTLTKCWFKLIVAGRWQSEIHL
ncbi:hypothetical protein Cflav_PD2521 [Pedosphaera parvula Ellin514]|uniref:Uncharacterized protein n=1 Tax=Pedosphaera parvula (strain Ellin514) TaxID=320771 RepID=B9XK62_PEDPL|nr:hypothetical protein Cflav_PD2521 [Pedosphaera parvula Ellin514]